ncbi:hypothetical protein D3C81_654600 [compost metagenome]
MILGLVIADLVIRMHEAAQAFIAMRQRGRRVTHQAFAAFADVGKVDLTGHRRPLQPENQSRNVGGDTLQPRLAFLQGRQGATPLGDIVEVNHQVFAIAKAQETQRDIGRQDAAISPHAIGFETLRALLTGPGALPQVQPTVHVQAGLEIDQGPIDDPSGRIAQHAFRRAVGVAHMAVPVDPEDADGALVDGKLGEPQGLFAGGAQGNVFLRGQQALLQVVLLATLPDHDGHATHRQHGQQQAEVLPKPRRLGEPRILGLQPLIVQLLQILGRDRPQCTFDNARQFRFVTERGHPQQLRQADIPHHHQSGELRFDRQASQLRLIDHRISRLLARQ